MDGPSVFDHFNLCNGGPNNLSSVYANSKNLYKYLRKYLSKLVKGPSINYRKVASSRLSRLVAHFQIFRRLMKGKFDAYGL